MPSVLRVQCSGETVRSKNEHAAYVHGVSIVCPCVTCTCHWWNSQKQTWTQHTCTALTLYAFGVTCILQWCYMYIALRPRQAKMNTAYVHGVSIVCPCVTCTCHWWNSQKQTWTQHTCTALTLYAFGVTCILQWCYMYIALRPRQAKMNTAYVHGVSIVCPCVTCTCHWWNSQKQTWTQHTCTALALYALGVTCTCHWWNNQKQTWTQHTCMALALYALVLHVHVIGETVRSKHEHNIRARR